ncbi:molybdopterin-containing oxidoreductase family protein [Patulibacter defluvii]|uniref:molybdopterin-containing oxidoreductase family protein n=1 Tax=Patulibacter defluvii TaxID=3095358 RepID=UPI002A761721|nr:molybdopterin-dependent oxidoreductase [Patulibacter sp. DM4]
MTEDKLTFCRICEPLCGMVATVDGDRLVRLRPDRDHPLSRGFACPKGIAFSEIQNDPDRVLHPLRRTADGGFERVSWETAISDIGARLRRIHGQHGPSGIGWYFGNPSAFSYSHTLWVAAFMQALGSPHVFSAGSQDVNNRFVASRLLYGSSIVAPVPDLGRSELLVVIGANPLVSHGSVMTAPRIKEQLHGIVERGGRVVVVDPRRTETARAFDWLPVAPDGDAFLLLSLLHVLFEERLADEQALARQATGAAGLRALARPFAPERTAARSGVPAAQVRALARDLARTERAAVYGRTGTCLGRAGTLTTFLLDAVNLVAGNLDREGGSMFGTLGVPGERAAGLVLNRLIDRADRHRSRIGGLPSVLGTEPAAVMAKEITTPGPGRIRALMVSSGNPVLSVPNGDELEAALDDLELLVSIDLYVNETNAHADYVLPATTMYERDDFPLAFQTLHLTPFRQATAAVVPPAGEARQEWEIVDDLMRELWRASPLLAGTELVRRGLGLVGRRLTPRPLVDALVRLGEGGDRFGLRRGGLSLRRLLEQHPHGTAVAPALRAGVLGRVVLHRGGRVRLDPPAIAAEVARLQARRDDDRYPLRLIGMRELRSENSWMHNAPLLVRGGRTQAARIHPEDAAAIGVEDGALVRLASRHGAIELPALVTDEVARGVVAVPHGWGHKGTGGWRRANAAGGGDEDAPVGRPGGVNVNRLMSSDPADLEPLAGMAHLTAVPVRAEPVVPAAADGSGGARVGAAAD